MSVIAGARLPGSIVICRGRQLTDATATATKPSQRKSAFTERSGAGAWACEPDGIAFGGKNPAAVDCFRWARPPCASRGSVRGERFENLVEFASVEPATAHPHPLDL